MKTEVKEIEVKVARADKLYPEYFRATIRDGEIANMDRITAFPDAKNIKNYTQFCQEIIEAIEMMQ